MVLSAHSLPLRNLGYNNVVNDQADANGGPLNLNVEIVGNISVVHLEGTRDFVPPFNVGLADDAGNNSVVLGGDGGAIIITVGGFNVAPPPILDTVLGHLQLGGDLEHVPGDEACVMDVLVHSPVIVVATRHHESVAGTSIALGDGERSAMISSLVPESKVPLLKVGVLDNVVRAVEIVWSNGNVIDRHVEIGVGIFGVEIRPVRVDDIWTWCKDAMDDAPRILGSTGRND